MRHRILTHHLPLLVLSAVSIAALYGTRPYRDAITRASFATAYPALVLLAITLLIGPWNLIRKRRNPLSGDLRRDIGIWAGILGVVHSVIGQLVHLRGRPWLYYVYAQNQHKSFPLRHDLFGFANYTGLLGALILITLLATSNNFSMRRLGTPRWKQLQRGNYAIFALVAAHTIAYQTSEKQHTIFVVAAATSIALTIALQIAGFLLRSKQLVFLKTQR
ncbi:MAG: hypothetical protein ABI197_09475 [Granulicella sp.]